MTDSEITQARLERLALGFTASGLPLTTQRRVIMEVLAERTDHPTADHVHAAVVERLPEVSRTTVYRALEVLTELGLIRRVAHPSSAARFDPETEPHHHFQCTRCGALTDLPLDAVRGSQDLAFAGDPSARVSGVDVTVRGTCATCVSNGS